MFYIIAPCCLIARIATGSNDRIPEFPHLDSDLKVTPPGLPREYQTLSCRRPELASPGLRHRMGLSQAALMNWAPELEIGKPFAARVAPTLGSSAGTGWFGVS